MKIFEFQPGLCIGSSLHLVLSSHRTHRSLCMNQCYCWRDCWCKCPTPCRMLDHNLGACRLRMMAVSPYFWTAAVLLCWLRKNINAFEVEPYPAREAEWKINLRVTEGKETKMYELFYLWIMWHSLKKYSWEHHHTAKSWQPSCFVFMMPQGLI